MAAQSFYKATVDELWVLKGLFQKVKKATDDTITAIQERFFSEEVIPVIEGAEEEEGDEETEKTEESPGPLEQHSEESPSS